MKCDDRVPILSTVEETSPTSVERVTAATRLNHLPSAILGKVSSCLDVPSAVCLLSATSKELKLTMQFVNSEYWREKFIRHFPHREVREDAISWMLKFNKACAEEYKNLSKREAELFIAVKDADFAYLANLRLSDLDLVDSRGDKLFLWIKNSQRMANYIYEVIKERYLEILSRRRRGILSIFCCCLDSHLSTVVDEHERNLLHWAVNFNQPTGVIQELLDNGFDINSVDAYCCTALHLAAEAGHLPVVQLLLAAGANVNLTQTNGVSPLHKAVEKGHLLVVQALLAAGANVNLTQANDASSLHKAAERGHLPVLHVLLAAGADVNASFGNNITSLHLAARMGHHEVVRALIAAGAHVNATLTSGATALHLAAKNGYLEVASTLLEAGAAIDQSASLVITPLEAGAAIDRSVSGATPLFVAVEGGQLPMVQALLAAGAHVNATLSNGATPLDVAEGMGYREIAELLLIYGATGQTSHNVAPSHT